MYIYIYIYIFVPGAFHMENVHMMAHGIEIYSGEVRAGHVVFT